MKTKRELEGLFQSAIEQVSMLPHVIGYAEKRQVEYAIEARHRLEQMLYALRGYRRGAERARRVDGAISRLPKPLTMQMPAVRRLQNQRGRIRTAMTTYGEAFYFFAHRATKCFQQIDGFRGFRPDGTENTRHKLIAHPEQLEPAPIHRNFRFSEVEGFQVKPFRREGTSREFPDAGFYVNAEGFVTELLRKFARSGTSDQFKKLVRKDRATRRRIAARERRQSVGSR